MSNVVRLYTPNEVEILWEDYASLARQLTAGSPALTDRNHIEATARAMSRFQKAFLALENLR